jgi:branched-chain amino acid aminotransferase
LWRAAPQLPRTSWFCRNDDVAGQAASGHAALGTGIPEGEKMAEGLVWIGGRFVAPAEARVSLFDRGYLVGDSVFATLRAHGGRPFRLDAHLESLARGAEALGIALAPAGAALADRVRETLARSGLAEAAIRITLSRGEGPGGIATAACTAPTLSVAVRPFVPYPAEAYESGIASGLVTTRRIPPECLDPALKTGAYLPNVLARRELEARGMIEGIMRSVAGAPLSGTVSNLFLVVGGRLLTPSVESGCRPGITRGALLELAGPLGIAAEMRALNMADLDAAEEIFFSNALMEVLPVASLEGRPLAGSAGPVTRTLADALKDLVRRETA